jgi:hypothetical protein
LTLISDGSTNSAFATRNLFIETINLQEDPTAIITSSRRIGVNTPTPLVLLDVNGDTSIRDNLFLSGNFTNQNFTITSGEPEIDLNGSRLILDGDTTTDRDAIFWTQNGTRTWDNFLDSNGTLRFESNTNGTDFEIFTNGNIIREEGSFIDMLGSSSGVKMRVTSNINIDYWFLTPSGNNSYAQSAMLAHPGAMVPVGSMSEPVPMYYDLSSLGIGYETSSVRFKKNIKELNFDHDKMFKEIKPVTYNDKNTDNPKEFVGFLAEDVEKFDPRLVIHDDEGKPASLNYSKFVPYLFDVIKELREEINTLKNNK